MCSTSLKLFTGNSAAAGSDGGSLILGSTGNLTLKDLIISSSIYYDPPNVSRKTNIEEDKELLDIYREFSELQESDTTNVSPWIIRLVF